MKKIFSIIVFFILIFAIIYIVKGIDPKKGISLNDITKLVSGSATEEDKNRIWDNLKSIDLKKLGEEQQKKFIDVLGKDLFSGKKLLEFLKLENIIDSGIKDTYYKTIFNNFIKDPAWFLKETSKINYDEFKGIFKIFIDKYIEKPKLIEELEKFIKNQSYTEEQKENVKKFVEEIKK